jgi:hypothetical protein
MHAKVDNAYLLAFAPDCDCILPMGSLALCLHKLLGQLSVSHTFRSVPAPAMPAKAPSGRKRPFVSSVMR